VVTLGKKNITVENGRVRTEKVVAYKKDLFDVSIRLVFAEGLPSTGKTLNAIEAGIEQVLAGTYDKLVIVRPVLDLETGYLPGDMQEKMSPFTRQSKEYINRCTMQGYNALLLTERIEVIPSTALQGNHFRNCFVVIDEAQNIHQKQTFKVISRVGDNAKFVVIGDTSLGQENSKIRHNSMLAYCVRKFEPYNRPEIAVHSFYDEDDILGDDFTKFLIVTLMPDFVNPPMGDEY
jgi:phosphate starvation-inducible PhoH-like protein